MHEIIVVHGLLSSKRQIQIDYASNLFLKKGFNVTSYDATNSFGESAGNPSKFTLTSHISDLCDVINYVSQSSRKIILCGFSLGATASLIACSRYPELVKSVIAIAPVVSGELYCNAAEARNLGIINRWKETGFIMRQSPLDPNVSTALGFDFIDDLMKYDLAKQVSEPAASITFVTGNRDETVPIQDVETLHGLWPSSRFISFDGPHTARTSEELRHLGCALEKAIEMGL